MQDPGEDERRPKRRSGSYLSLDKWEGFPGSEGWSAQLSRSPIQTHSEWNHLQESEIGTSRKGLKLSERENRGEKDGLSSFPGLLGGGTGGGSREGDPRSSRLLSAWHRDGLRQRQKPHPSLQLQPPVPAFPPPFYYLSSSVKIHNKPGSSAAFYTDTLPFASFVREGLPCLPIICGSFLQRKLSSTCSLSCRYNVFDIRSHISSWSASTGCSRLPMAWVWAQPLLVR